MAHTPSYVLSSVQMSPSMVAGSWQCSSYGLTRAQEKFSCGLTYMVNMLPYVTVVWKRPAFLTWVSICCNAKSLCNTFAESVISTLLSLHKPTKQIRRFISSAFRLLPFLSLPATQYWHSYFWEVSCLLGRTSDYFPLRTSWTYSKQRWTILTWGGWTFLLLPEQL